MRPVQNDQTVKLQETARMREDLHGKLESIQEVMTWALLGSLEEDGQTSIPAESCGGCVAPSFSNCRGFSQEAYGSTGGEEPLAMNLKWF